MSAGAMILNDVLGGTYKKQLNPAVTHVDTNGNFTDSQGNVVPAYVQPNWFQRTFSPAAQQAQAENAAYASAPLIAQQNYAIQKKLALQRAMPALQAMAGSRLQPDLAGTTADIMYGSGVIGNSGELSPDAYMNLGRQWNNAQAGISKPLSEADVLGAQNAAVGQYANKTYGVPQAQAYNAAAQNNLQGTIANGDLSSGYVPQLIANRLGGAQLEGAMTGQHLSDLPYTLPAMRNEAVGGLIGSQYQPMGSYMGNRINEDGTVTPMSHNPYGGIPMMQTLGALQNGAVTSSPTVAGLVDKSGQPVSVKPTYNPLGGTVPTTSQPVGQSPAPHGGMIPIAGTMYSHDSNGNLFTTETGEYVPEENYKGTPIEKAFKHQLTLEDNVKKSAAMHIPQPRGLIGDMAKGLRDTYIPDTSQGIFDPSFEANHPLIAHPIRTIRGY